MSRPRHLRSLALSLANLLIPFAVLVFASGFFPYKPVLPGLATLAHANASNGEAGGGAAEARKEAVFDRVVFMVVDALRSDFVYGHNSAFAFTQSLVRSGAAIPFTAHATPPTVTMPRVKALTTGSVPSFLDLILNFAESDTSSSLAAQDTWLAQIKARGGNVVFYGDDTWLKLFPDDGFFLRAEGTSSFFVSDFTEVDHNVTRHVPKEMGRSDWDAMVLHYLGLDHIGHKTGPQGPNMLPKQREMDGMVRLIFEAMEREDHHEKTLLVLAGDHGMNAGGNHGGSGPGETEPALLFASPRFMGMREKRAYECPTTPKQGTEFHYYTKVEQSDLVPSLAAMMGLPVSRNSLGVLIPELYGLWEEPRTLEHLRQNAGQILQIVKATFGETSWTQAVSAAPNRQSATGDVCKEQPEGEPQLACLWAHAEARSADGARETCMDEARTALTHFLLLAQNTLSGTASSYNMSRMIIGMLLTASIILLALLSFPVWWPITTPGVFFALTSILYGIMMFASSYVEEEQHFWYWLTPAWILFLTIRNIPRKCGQDGSLVRLALAAFVLLAVHRFAVRWNQTGQKHAGEPDIVQTIFSKLHVLMWILILAAYGYHAYTLVTRAFAGLLSLEVAMATAMVLVGPAVVFKLNFTQADAPELVRGLARQIREWSEPFDLVLQARFAFASMAATTMMVVILSVLSHKQSEHAGMRTMRGLLPSLAERLHHLLTLFLMTQSRAPNIPLFLGMEFQREALAYILFDSPSPLGSVSDQEYGTRVTQIATSSLLLSHVYFFCTGGSNSISSIDLSNAYNGVANYNLVAVGVLLFASNWTGPIWWCSAANLLLSRNVKRSFFSPREARAKAGDDGKGWIEVEREKLRQEALSNFMRPEDTATSAGMDANDGVWSLYVSYMTAFVAIALLAVMATCTALRMHLFIWTVFSPKYLYAMAWSVGWHGIVNVGLGSLLGRLMMIA